MHKNVEVVNVLFLRIIKLKTVNLPRTAISDQSHPPIAATQAYLSSVAPASGCARLVIGLFVLCLKSLSQVISLPVLHGHRAQLHGVAGDVGHTCHSWHVQHAATPLRQALY